MESSLRHATPPNIVVLIADDLCKGSLGCYGDPHVRTPNIDRLATEGLRFERAYVTAPQCSPSRSSLFTGRTPHATGTSRLHAPLRNDVPTVLEPLREQGYFTGVLRKHHLGEDFRRRFDFSGGNDASASAFFRQAPADRPFFMWVGFNDPHRDLYTNYDHIRGLVTPPHDPAEVTVPPFLPDTPALRADLALHYDAIHRLDRDCGEVLRLLEDSGRDRNTVVVFMSDHGMPYPRAKATLYEAGINVPLVVRWPGRVAPHQVTSELVSSVDLPATWLELAGQPALPAMEGRSLLSLLTGRPHESRRYIHAERNWHDTWEPARAIVSQKHALICNCRPEVSYRGSLDHVSAPVWRIMEREHEAGRLPPTLAAMFRSPRPVVELYDLSADPHELSNLAENPAHAAVVDELLLELDRWMRATNDFLPPPASFPEIVQEGKLTMARMLDGPLPKL
ncbi:MAG: sulfatase [Opitutaceae bacterium]|nr:sulfatase [Opitutaceae bacterium]